MKFLLLPIFALAIASATAQEKLLDRFAPKPMQPAAGTKAEPPTVQPVTPPPDDPSAALKARGFVFISALPQFRPGGVPAFDGVRIENVPMLDSDAFRARIAPYLGKPVSMLLVQAVTAETINFFVEHDRPVVRVTAPEQDVTSGVLQFVIAEGQLSEVQVTGNRWFKSSLFKTRL